MSTPTLYAKVNGQWIPISTGNAPNTAPGSDENEVTVGASQPIDNSELWYDTTVSADVAVNYWNTAWGVIATGTTVLANASAVGAGATVDYAYFNATTVAGRRYEVEVYANASSASSTAMNWQLHMDGVFQGGGSWNYTNGNYTNLHGQWLLAPAAGAHSFRISFSASGAYGAVYNDGGYVVLRDVGPVTRVAVEPASQTPPTTVASGNALGVIALGAVLASSVDVTTAATPSAPVPITQTVTFTAVIGRRYRLTQRIAASTAKTGPGTVYGVAFEVYEGTNTLVGDSDQWFWMGGAYSGAVLESYFNGDGASHTVRSGVTVVNAGAGTAVTIFPKQLVIEDVGPSITPALPVPAADPAWTTMTLTAGSVPGGWQAPRYRRIGDIVYIDGMVATTANNQQIFTFPAGFRPNATREHPVSCWNGSVRIVGSAFVYASGALLLEFQVNNYMLFSFPVS